MLRAGARVKPNKVILQLSNPDLDHQLLDGELATKKSEAELANLRVQLESQLLNEKALEAQLQSEATEARLQAERDCSVAEDAAGNGHERKDLTGQGGVDDDSVATRKRETDH